MHTFGTVYGKNMVKFFSVRNPYEKQEFLMGFQGGLGGWSFSMVAVEFVWFDEAR